MELLPPLTVVLVSLRKLLHLLKPVLFRKRFSLRSLSICSNVLLVLFPRSLRLILESILQEVFRLQRRTARRLQNFLRKQRRILLVGSLLLLFHRTPILNSRFRLFWLLMFQMIGRLFLRIVHTSECAWAIPAIINFSGYVPTISSCYVYSAQFNCIWK